MKQITTITFFTLLFLLGACGENDEKEEFEKEAQKLVHQPDRNLVRIELLKKGIFQKELVSNGKLESLRKSELSFPKSEVLTAIKVKNGARVKKGQVIAEQEIHEYLQNLNKAIIQVKKSRIDFENMVIGQGFELKDSVNIPKGFLEIAKIKSGYLEALQQEKEAKRALKNTKLITPFNGKIANLKAKEFEFSPSGDPFCVLIDDDQFEVVFKLMEGEVSLIKEGMKVQISPFSNTKNYEGLINAINPLVDKHGLVEVRAILPNVDGTLMEGMNVKVKVVNEVPDQFVVPKSAVILRQNKEVMFRCIGGKAYWTYVLIVGENSTSYAVIPNAKRVASFAEGDSLIISGNLNLAHDSPVKISN